MIINHNITALNTHNKLSSASAAQGKSMEKLASGLRINKAGDDAAGLAISEKMRAQVRGLDQASRNAQDGISLTQTAEGALNETHDILQRMRELSVQASNDTNTGDDRNEIQKEINQLNSEVDRISNTTEFNTQSLLNGSLGAKGTSNNTANVDVVSTSGLAKGTYDVKVTLEATKATKTAATGADNTVVATAAGKDLLINGVKINTTGVSTIEDLKVAVNAVKDKTGVEMTVGANGSASKFESTSFGSTGKIDFAGTDALWLKDKVLGTAGNVEPASVAGVDAKAEVKDNATSVTSAITGVGQKIIYGNAEFSAKGTANSTATITVNSTGASIHIGANKDQNMLIDINEMSTKTLGNTSDKIKDVNVTTTSGAEKAIKTVDDAIKQVSAERSKMGSVQNRLEHTINNLKTSSENLTAAESRVRDVDMAKEMMNQTKNSILAQAAQAMLAQSNQTPQGVLQLLR